MTSTTTHMHRILFIREILLIIFGHCFSSESSGRADVAALARTCRTFKEPALDLLWETLPNLSPLARCLSEAFCKPYKATPRVYSFSRPLSELEWNTLRGYTRRVWHLHGLESLDDHAMTVMFTLAPFTNALFPNLQTLDCQHRTLAVYAVVPSLTSLCLRFGWILPFSVAECTAFFDTVGERCRNMRDFTVFSLCERLDQGVISRQLCRWPNLQSIDCPDLSLSMDAILRLPSMSTLRKLSFSLRADLDNDLSHLGSVIVFSALAKLEISSATLKPITNLLSRIQLPAIKDLDVFVPGNESKRDVQEYWTVAQKACSSNTLTHLSLSAPSDDPFMIWHDDDPDKPFLTLDDLLPYKDFGNLHKIAIDLAWPVKLTDADLLDLVSTSPQLEELSINNQFGWRVGPNGGITLSGLVQLLRQCPSLHDIAIRVDERTLVEIPHSTDLSFPPREELFLHCLDSFFTNSVDPQPVFDLLGLDHYGSWASFG